jgi:rubredoxin
LQELNQEETAMPAEEGKAEDDMREGEDLAEGEKEEIEKKIQHIHWATGHGSMKNLVETLEKQGVPAKVLQVAKQWKCPMCETYKKLDPRRFSTLETIPRHWQCVQMDMGSCCHPGTKKKFHFLMMVDEGSRFRMGRIVSYNPANNTTWITIQQVFTESWLPIFGQPQVLWVDPQGPMMGSQADQYSSEHGFELQPIPAEARWQIILVDGAIKTTKGMMETLSAEYPDMPPAEHVGRAIWVMNCRDLFKGYAPLQHALGRCPDDHDHLLNLNKFNQWVPNFWMMRDFEKTTNFVVGLNKCFRKNRQ